MKNLTRNHGEDFGPMTADQLAFVEAARFIEKMIECIHASKQGLFSSRVFNNIDGKLFFEMCEYELDEHEMRSFIQIECAEGWNDRFGNLRSFLRRWYTAAKKVVIVKEKKLGDEDFETALCDLYGITSYTDVVDVVGTLLFRGPADQACAFVKSDLQDTINTTSSCKNSTDTLPTGGMRPEYPSISYSENDIQNEKYRLYASCGFDIDKVSRLVNELRRKLDGNPLCKREVALLSADIKRMKEER